MRRGLCRWASDGRFSGVYMHGRFLQIDLQLEDLSAPQSFS